MASSEPKVKLQLEAISASTKSAFKGEAASKGISPSDLFEAMWRAYIASQANAA